MDLRLFARVVWRFRVVVGLGVVLALALATLSYVRVSFAGGPSVKYRQSEQWVSYTRLFVTQSGFRWGSSVVNPSKGTLGNQANVLGLQTASESRLSSLATIYANLIDSDAVLALMRREGPVRGIVQAAPLPVAQGSDSVLPIISIAAFAASPTASVELARHAGNALRLYIERQQELNGIAPGERIKLAVVSKAGATKLYAGRKKTLPIVVFLTVMLAVIGLAFTLENVRPRIRAISGTGSAPAPPLTAERVHKTAS